MNIDEFSDIYIVYADSDHQESLIVLHDFNKCLIILFREGNVVRKGVILNICKKNDDLSKDLYRRWPRRFPDSLLIVKINSQMIWDEVEDTLSCDNRFRFYMFALTKWPSRVVMPLIAFLRFPVPEWKKVFVGFRYAILLNCFLWAK